MSIEEKLFEVWELVGDARRLILTADSADQAFALVDALQPPSGATTIDVVAHIVTDQEGILQVRRPNASSGEPADRPRNPGTYRIRVQQSAGTFGESTVDTAKAALAALAKEAAQGNTAWVEDRAGHLISRIELQRLKTRGR